jgi:hypothetical protein
MTRDRSQKRHQSSRKSTDENDHSHTGLGEEIATPPAQHMSPRRGRPIDFTEMNTSITQVMAMADRIIVWISKRNLIQRKRIRRKRRRRRRRTSRRRRRYLQH